MFEDNFEPISHLNFNMQNFSNCRRRISHFQIQSEPTQNHTPHEEHLTEDSAKNILIDIDETEHRHPLRPKDRITLSQIEKNIMNGWVQRKNEGQKPFKSFRTKVYSKNRSLAYNQVESLRHSAEGTQKYIPKLKDLLKKLESPERQQGSNNLKENQACSEKKNEPYLDNCSVIPYRFQSVFHTINCRKSLKQKRKRIITFSQYRSNHKKPYNFEQTDNSLEKIANILVIKQAAKKVGLKH